LHETGQPLHAFDLDKITGNKVIVKTAVENSVFKTLDEKERKLLATDLMICNEVEPMCIAGVFGGAESGIKNNTQNIFLESACFEKQSIRKTALKHDLRTDASARFEKGVDISNTLVVLKRAAQLIKEIAGGKISGNPIDIYPNQQPKTVIDFEFSFLKKLSGKKYEASDVKAILLALSFELLEETESQLKLAVPYSKPDISIQADVVEEIMRIDGLDNIDIPSTITISPSIEKNNRPFILKEKLANTFVGMGFYEIFTNSITNSAFYSEEQLKSGVKMINSLTSELDMLRLEMLPSGLQVIAHNINRKNHQLRLFEFGKTYFNNGENKYQEKNNLVIYVSAAMEANNWQKIEQPADFYYLKSVVEQVLKISEVKKISTQQIQHPDWKYGVELLIVKNKIGSIGEISSATLKKFDVKHPVYFAEIDMDYIYSMKNKSVQYKELPKFPAVQRDLAVVVNKAITYAQLEKVANAQQIQQLTSISLFDIFESEKLGADKKSMALSFTFLDDTKTLTDKEIDVFTQKIMDGFEKQLQAEIRK
jgi:phenylalanyl-tRNA synthetase beta chain